MSSLEFKFWRHWASRKPFGYEMKNWRAGMVAATVANCTPRKVPRKLKPKDFYPVLQATRPQMTEEQRKELEKRRRKREKLGLPLAERPKVMPKKKGR